MAQEISHGEISDRVRELVVFKFPKRDEKEAGFCGSNYIFCYLLKEGRGETWSALEVKYGISYSELIGELREVLRVYSNGHRPNLSEAGCAFSQHERIGIEEVFEESDSGRQPKS